MQIVIPVPDGDYITAHSIMTDIIRKTGYACYINYEDENNVE